MAILGYNTVGASSYYLSDHIDCCVFTTTEGGTITSMDFEGFKDFGGTASVRMALYSSASLEPENLLAYSSPVLITSTEQWWNFPFFTEQVPGGLTFASAGIDLWFCFENNDPGTIVIKYDTPAGTDQFQISNSTPAFGTWDNPITTILTKGSAVLSCRATYTPTTAPITYGSIDRFSSIERVTSIERL